MALWKKDEEVPPELQGKSPQEIVAMLNEAKNIKTQLDAAVADKTTTASELETLKAQQAENLRLIEELKAAQPVKPVVTDVNEPANPWLDPNKWLQENTQDTRNIALISGIMAAKNFFMNSLSPVDSKIFRKFEKEIDKAMEGYQPQMRIIPQNWEMALTLVKGRHYEEIAKMSQQGGEFFSEQSSSGLPQPPVSTDKLSPDEEEACRVMHWDPKRYLEQRKKMGIVSGDKGSVARFTNE